MISLTKILSNLLPVVRPVRQMTSSGPIQESMRRKLSEALSTTYLEIINESHMHNVPKNAETHFKVVVVSEKFYDVPQILRHRMVHEILKNELLTGVHALSIVTKTPDQWEKLADKTIEPSPNCRGGFGK